MPKVVNIFPFVQSRFSSVTTTTNQHQTVFPSKTDNLILDNSRNTKKEKKQWCSFKHHLFVFFPFIACLLPPPSGFNLYDTCAIFFLISFS